MNTYRDLAFIVLCLCGIVVATIHMSKYKLVIGCIGSHIWLCICIDNN